MSDKKATVARYRNFGAVLYPESAPANWREIVADWKFPVFVSPLHDRDVDPQQQPKKPHYHIVLAYDGPKSPDQARERFDEIGAVGCETVQSIRGYCRYLCHLDNPEKAQYDPEQVLTFGGSDYADVIGLPTDKYKAIDDMIEYCEQNSIVSYRTLINYARSPRRDWFRVLCDNGTYVVKEYLKSRTWENDARFAEKDLATRADDDGVILDEDPDHIEPTPADLYPDVLDDPYDTPY